MNFKVVFAEDASDKEIHNLRKTMECVADVFVELAVEHKELQKHFTDYQTLTEETNLLLANCEKPEHFDLKKE